MHSARNAPYARSMYSPSQWTVKHRSHYVTLRLDSDVRCCRSGVLRGLTLSVFLGPSLSCGDNIEFSGMDAMVLDTACVPQIGYPRSILGRAQNNT